MASGESPNAGPDVSASTAEGPMVATAGAAAAVAVEANISGPFSDDPTVLGLTEPAQRAAVVALAKALQAPPPDGRFDLEDSQGLYDSPRALIRYLRARQWRLGAAEEMIRATARWRHEFDHAGIRQGRYTEAINRQNASGKLYVRGFDNRGRPVLYIKTRYETSEDPQNIVRHLVYNVERAVACLERMMQEGRVAGDVNDTRCGKFVLLVDLSKYSLQNMIPMPVAKEVMMILQDHYPERLGAAFLIEAPWMMSGLFGAITPFLDPVTVDKFQFVTECGAARSERMAKYFDLLVLEPEFGGTASSPFASPVYLGTEAGDDVFGLEFNEQAQMEQSQSGSGLGEQRFVASTAPLPARPSGPAVAASASPSAQPQCQEAFWRVCSDMRVLALGKQQRAAVRALAKSLAVVAETEEPGGLFDDAGSLIRYLSATEWCLTAAEARIRASARWRKEFDFAAQRAGEFDQAIATESANGNMYVRGYDRRGRPVLVVKLRARHSGCEVAAIRHMVYCVERAVACLERREAEARARCSSYGEAEAEIAEAGGKLTVLVDFTGYSRRNRPALHTIRDAASIMQQHYPERLGDAFLLHPPLKVSTLWKAVKHTVDPTTSQKVVVVKDARRHAELLETLFDRRSLEMSLGGENGMPFDSRVFMFQGVRGSVYGLEFDDQLLASVQAGFPRPDTTTMVASESRLKDEEDDEKQEEEGTWWFPFSLGPSVALW